MAFLINTEADLTTATHALLAQLPLCDLIQQQPAAQATQTLKAELATLQSLATTLSGLQDLLDQLNTIDLNKLVYADGVTSAVKTRPEKGGVHSIAATSFADLKILQLLSDQFASHTGTPVGTPFLELKGVNSSADAFVNGKDTSKPAGTASLGEIDVLGQRVLDVNGTLSDALHQTLNAGTTITKTVTTPIGDLTLVVSRGEPKPVNNGAQRKTMQVAALDVALINGDTDGSHAITQLGAQRGGKIVDVAVAQSQVDAAMTVVPQCAPADCSASVTINPVLPSTGMLGPLGFLAAAGLAAVAVSLRLAGRRRRRVG